MKSGAIDFGQQRESLDLPNYVDPVTVVYAPPDTLSDWSNVSLSRADLEDDRIVSHNLRGPIGSAKTTGLVWMPKIVAVNSMPCNDGVIRVKATFVRNTYPELVSTLIKSFEEWFGPNANYPPVVYSSPIMWKHTWYYTDHPPIELVCWFLSMDRAADARKLRGLETTIMCGSEAAEEPFEYMEHGPTRCGRYPPAKYRPRGVKKDHWPPIYGMWNETNSPSDASWWYELEVHKRPDKMRFLRQPGGLSKGAENIENLPGGKRYYLEAIQGKSDSWIKAFVHNEFATLNTGLAVWPEFNTDLHVSKEPLEFDPSVPLWLSFDFGLTPAAIAFQVSKRGQLRVLREYVTRIKSTKTEDRDEHGMLPGQMGIIRFAKTVVEPGIQRDFWSQHNEIEMRGTCDPGGTGQRSNEKSSYHHLLSVFPFINTARTNVFEERRIAVAARWDQLIAGEPAIVIDPTCRTLIRGCEGEYQFDQVQVATSQGLKYKLEPDKQNWTSHVCDTLGYAAVDGLPRLDQKHHKRGPAIPPGRVMHRS